MPNPTSLLADALSRNLAEAYRRNYGKQEPHILRVGMKSLGSSLPRGWTT
jgi:hypothetical protein